ncbi:MAG: hypothetical protein M3O90_05115 [Actinomycetota bacterium]|nr:hypothetical protein [Actinomycetota bacterium]
MNGNETVQLFEYLRAVRLRWRLVLLIATLATGAALAVSLSSEKQYDATVDLLLRQHEPANALLDPGASAGSTDEERDLTTNVELIKVGSTAKVVRRRLGLRRSIDDLLEQVATRTSNTSNVVGLTVRDPDPELAARIANEFATAYVQFRRTSARERYTQAADLATSQLAELSPEERNTIEGRDLQSRQRELEIAAALQTGGAEIVRPAEVPTAAARPRPLLSGLLGLGLGVIFSVCVALGLELFDRRFKDEVAVEDFFGLPILGAIPRSPRRVESLDDYAQQEAFGLLAANLRLSAPHATKRRAAAARAGAASSVLMVTSPGPGDGKTSVTFGIARACARLGLRAMLIEADLRRPAFHRFGDMTPSLGVTGVLEGSAHLADELIWLGADSMQPAPGQEQDEGMLAVLPAGALPVNPQLTMVQPAMRSLVESARSLADVVLIDTAPVGIVNDPVTMARLVDGVVLVARLNQTTKDAARRALRVLRNVEVPLIGVVITDAAATEVYSYYGPVPGAAPVKPPRISVAPTTTADPRLPTHPPVR